jgi:signal transduction histidine kinase
MDDNGCAGSVQSPVTGRIAGGAYSPELKSEVSRLVRRYADFDDSESPAMPYIAAWSESGGELWYEFAGRGLVALLGGAGNDLAGRFRRSVQERRVYRREIADGPIAEEVLQETQLADSRSGLRFEVKRRGLVEALYRIALADGQGRWLKDLASVRAFPADRIYLSLGCLTDVSKEMEAEEARLRLESDKRRLERELQQLQRLEAVGSLASGIGRRFGELLAHIGRSCSGLLAEFDATGKALAAFDRYRLLKEVEGQIDRGQGLIQQLMAISGAARRDPLPSDLGEIAHQALISLRCTRPELEIRLHRPPGLWPVEVDRSQIGEVILDLCLRILETAPIAAGLDLALTNRHVDRSHAVPYGIEAGRFVDLSIRGMGLHLEESACQRIFEPFFKVRPFLAAGLELASAYGIIRSHGGMIQADCPAGRDTTFHILLPVIADVLRNGKEGS